MDELLKNETKDVEIFMLYQFIDVLEVIGNCNNMNEIKKDIEARKATYLEYIKNTTISKSFWDLSLCNESINEKIEKAKNIYTSNSGYQAIIKMLEDINTKLEEKLDNEEKINLEKLKDLIYELCDLDMNLAYKIGLIEGIKTNNQC